MSRAELEAYIVEIERLKRRIVELEHGLETQEWGAQAFTESTLPQLLLDPETGAILAGNPSAGKFYGYPLRDLVGKYCSDLSADPHCWMPELVQRVRQLRYGTEPARHRTASGEVRELEAHYSLIAFRGREVLHVVLIDVTDRNRYLRDLEASEQRYREFFSFTNIGIWYYTAPPIPISLPVEEQIQRIIAQARLADCNPAYAKMYGYETPEEMIGEMLHQRLIPDTPENIAMLRYFIENGYKVEAMESLERTKSGENCYILNSFVGVVQNDCLVAAWGAQIDITELRRLQQELEQAYRLETIGRLAGGVAHDFNNLLTAILGYAELALERTRDEQARKYLEGIQKAGQRASGLTRQLLAYARKQVFSPVAVNLEKWLEEVQDFLRRLLPENVRLEAQVSPNLKPLFADPDQLTQIVLNLAVNARDAMLHGGVLTIRLYEAEPTHYLDMPHGAVVLEVSDTGTGISPDVLPHIFEPFYTTKPKGQGTGMGLSAVHGIVQQMKGRIEVETREGKGTTFQVILPHRPQA